jgi:hypothetical protein
MRIRDHCESTTRFVRRRKKLQQRKCSEIAAVPNSISNIDYKTASGGPPLAVLWAREREAAIVEGGASPARPRPEGAPRGMRRLAVRKTYIALLTGLVWLAATAGATEPVAERIATPPVPETSEGPGLQVPGDISGTVTQAIDVREYTYVEINTGDGLVWVAGPVTDVRAGDSVEVPRGIEMIDFTSTVLDRTFDKIQLVHVIRVKPRQPGDGNAGPDLDVSGIERIEGGQTVAEIIANKASLSGNEVTVRGKVMKMNAGIMGRNWMHLSDGTVGPGGEKEIMVTTDDVAKVGSIVVVRGPVATDQDYGYGYRYDVLIVKAKLKND